MPGGADMGQRVLQAEPIPRASLAPGTQPSDDYYIIYIIHACMYTCILFIVTYI